MKIKKYLVKDMQQAISQIKKDMGPEAIIISQRKVRGPGLWGFFTRRLEVTVALEENSPANFAQALNRELRPGVSAEPRPESADRQPELPPETISNNEEEKSAPAASKVSRESTLACPEEENTLPFRMQKELEEVKNLLQQVVRTREEEGYVPEQQQTFHFWRQKLITLDFLPEQAEKVLNDLPREAFKEEKAVLPVLIKQLTSFFEPFYQEEDRPAQVISFIGPTGVGKTTTLAKLAAQYTLFQQKKVAILTIDTYRIGAVEQLQTYAEIIGVPLQVVISPAELAAALEKNKDRDHILIDTTGRPFTKLEQREELKSFLAEVKRPHDVFLLLSANTKTGDLLQTVEYFAPCNFNKLIFTKTDETLTLGSIFNVVAKVRLPVVYITNGQNVPDDIAAVNAGSLARLVLKGVDL